MSSAAGPSRRSQVTPFAVMEVLAEVARLRAAGRDVISLCAGEPGGGAPAAVSEAAARVHAERLPLGYTPALGLTELRTAIAEHYRDWYGLELAPERVAVTTGSSGAFVLSFLAAFDHGDRVALARPGYPAYRNILASLGCEVLDLDCGPAERYQPSVDQLAEAHARTPIDGLVLASPANPTGTMVTRSELTAIADWCRAEGVRLISDEIYHGVTYPQPGAADPRGVCAAAVDDTAVVVSSFSKYWGMTGWRLGWAVLPQDLVAPVAALAGNVALCPPAPAQLAALAAFSDAALQECEGGVAEFARTRDLVLAQAPRLGWGPAAPADGAFYYYAALGQDQLRRWGDAPSYAAALLDATGVALTPGDDFDARAGSRHVRLSFAAGYDAVAEALERIITWQADAS